MQRARIFWLLYAHLYGLVRQRGTYLTCWAVFMPFLPEDCWARLAPSNPFAFVPLRYLPVKRPCAFALSSEPCLVSERFNGPRLRLSQVPWYSVPNAGEIAIIDTLYIGGDSTF